MEIFDLHADIGFDVLQKRQAKETNILNTYHVDKLQEGEVTFISIASNFEGEESWEDMQEMILALKEELALCEKIDVVLTKDDLLCDNGHCKAILSVEGMCGIKDDPLIKIEWLYQQGVRIASLCWNDENALASGVNGNPHHGLTSMGKAVIERMISLSMGIDVSHANEKTFWDIMEYKEAKVLATHSNVRNLCPHKRNLWDEQLKAIAKHQGIIGVVSAPTFVSEKKAQQDIPHMIEHIAYLKQLLGINHVALGFDYMDFYPHYESFHIQGLKDASNTQNLINQMLKEGWNAQDVMQIAAGNAIRFLFDIL